MEKLQWKNLLTHLLINLLHSAGILTTLHFIESFNFAVHQNLLFIIPLNLLLLLLHKLFGF